MRIKPIAADIDTTTPPAETVALRRALNDFFRQPLSLFVDDPPLTKKGKSISIGAVKWAVYAFFDYDGEPIYVGQTRESAGSRVGRHLTNQRTDAVAMSVLDPFEVYSVKLWLLPQYQEVKGDPKKSDEARQAADHLNRLERTIFLNLLGESTFRRILNEKDPPKVARVAPPDPIVGILVGDEVRSVRRHPDVRIARRSQTIARLAQIIAGRDVTAGLRRVLATQAERLSWLATERFKALGGDDAVPVREEDEPTESDVGEKNAD